jgi:hypothetical protein
MIEISAETLLTMAQATRLRPLGRLGRPTHPSTIYRWISRGVRGIRLESIRLGGTTYTSREALQRFADRLTTEPDLPAAPSTSRAALGRVDSALDRAGL